jgi:hypothetical protein
MKKIEITCDACEKEIDPRIMHGVLIIFGFPEINFCGIGCFDDWVKKKYLKVK